MFVGRKNELALLQRAYESTKSELVVLYGRRRIGKSCLIQKFSNKKQFFYGFEAIEGDNTKGQVKHFTHQLRQQVDDTILASVNFSDWNAAFTYISERILNLNGKDQQQKTILFFDELQWMASGRNKLISLLKYYWDTKWKERNVMLILCGSVATFMVKNVLRSKALYGRTTLEILLQGLLPAEAYQFLGRKRSLEEILQYLLVFGGVPKYLEQIDLNRSFKQNINALCFSNHAIMLNEPNRVFYNQFRGAGTYIKIITLLSKTMCTFNEISSKLTIASGGGLKLYLDNLEQAEMISSFIPYPKKIGSKFTKYALTDEFLIFFFKYIKPNIRRIRANVTKKLFETIAGDGFSRWMGFAFERFCLKHSDIIAGSMGFADDVVYAAPYFEKGDTGFQIDLLFNRADKVLTICEVKHHNNKIGSWIIPEMERKCSLFNVPRGYTLEKALISLYGPDDSLINSDYFHHSITMDDIFNFV